MSKYLMGATIALLINGLIFAVYPPANPGVTLVIDGLITFAVSLVALWDEGKRKTT